jgi:hypothetical protein
MRSENPKGGADALEPLRLSASVFPEDHEAAQLCREMESVPPLSEIAVARIRRRLERERDHQPRGGLPVWLKVAIGAAASLFLIETAAAATISAWPALHERFWTLVGNHVPRAARQPLPGDQTSAPLAISQDAVSKPRVEEPAQPPSAARVGNSTVPLAPAKRLARAASKPSAVTAPGGRMPSVDGPELALDTRALAQLHLEQNAAGALGTLRAYRLRYPQGFFSGDAVITEIKADLILGREAEVLSLLDAMTEQGFATAQQSGELGLLRAELLVHANRCDEALRALGPYLGPALPPDQRARALSSRDSCLAQIKGPRSPQTHE